MIARGLDAPLTVMEREYINQSEAARRRKVSRQCISELVAKGKFSTVMDNGKEIKGAIYADEITNYQQGKRGRPRLSDEEREARGLDKYHVDDWVRWNFIPRDGYGFHILITGQIKKVGLKRVLLEFKDAEGKMQTAWVNKEHLYKWETQ